MKYPRSCSYRIAADTLRDNSQDKAIDGDARKYHESLHFLFECHWYELTSADCPDRVEPELN